MREPGYSESSDDRLRADLAEEILDIAEVLLDSDTRTIGMTYGEAQNFIASPDVTPLNRELRRATIVSVESFHAALGDHVGTVAYADSRYRMVVAGPDALGRNINYGLTEVKTSVKALTRVVKMSMSDQITRRLRGVALTAMGEVRTMSEMRTKKTEEFELNARLLIGDELADMRDALLTGKELPFEMVVACLDDIRHALQLTHPDMNVDEFMAALYNHYEETRQATETRLVVYGGTSEMPTSEMVALRNYMDGHDSAIGIYDED